MLAPNGPNPTGGGYRQTPSHFVRVLRKGDEKQVDTLKRHKAWSATLPIPDDKQFDKLTVLSIAPMIARAINEVFSDGSVTSLFDGNS